MRTLSEQVCHIFGVPDFLHAWLDRFFDPDEYQLILAIGNAGLIPVESVQPGYCANFERAYRRGILKKDASGNFELADFHARFEIWALFEGWKDLPKEVQQQLNAWEFADYEARKSDVVEALKHGRNTEERSEYLLLHEAEAFLDEAEHIYLWPCNCRAMMQQCSKPLNVCLRFSNDRGIGWEISRERAKTLVREANRHGLMQLGETTVADDGSVAGSGLCNCCADCCYPHLLAERLNSQKIWPASRYVAEYHAGRCSGCGKCVRRCPFQAFERVEREQSPDTIMFIADRCRGCGMCAAACPKMAIRMTPLEEIDPWGD